MVVGMVDDEIRDGNPYSNILISALAIMGIGSDGTWVPPHTYTPVYAAVIKVARMLVLHQSAMARERAVARLEQTMSRQQAEEAAPGLFTIVRAKVRRFITRVSSLAEAYPTPGQARKLSKITFKGTRIVTSLAVSSAPSYAAKSR